VHRVLRRNSEYLHGECWSPAIRKQQSFWLVIAEM
jgi:hypothetical protein